MRSKGFRNSACTRTRQTRYVKLRKHIYQGNFNQSSSLVNFTSELKRLKYKSCLHAIACINAAHICTRDYRIWWASQHSAFHMRHPIMHSADLQTTQGWGLEVVSSQLILLQKLHRELPERVHGLPARHVRSYAADAEPSNPNAGILTTISSHSKGIDWHRRYRMVQDGTGTFADFLLVSGAKLRVEPSCIVRNSNIDVCGYLPAIVPSGIAKHRNTTCSGLMQSKTKSCKEFAVWASTKWLLSTRQIRPQTTLIRLMLKSATCKLRDSNVGRINDVINMNKQGHLMTCISLSILKQCAKIKDGVRLGNSKMFKHLMIEIPCQVSLDKLLKWKDSWLVGQC